MQIVTLEDLEPAGWICENEQCSRPFQVGDLAYGTPDAVTADGVPIESGFRCYPCWASG